MNSEMRSPPPWFIRGRLKTRQLLLLTAIAEEGNIHRAARQVNMTQPAASKLLKELEDALHVNLFERLPRGMRPTLYGEAMIRQARMALGNLGQAYDEIAALKSGLLGQVRVGAITTPGISLLPHAIASVKQTHPHLQISLDIDTSPALLAGLREGKLDMVVARLEVEQGQTLYRYVQLSDEPIGAYVRRQHPMRRAKALTLQAVADAPWIVPPAGSVLRQRFDLMYQTAGLLPPSNLIETSSLLFVTKMIEQSDMIALLSEAVGRYYVSHHMAAALPLKMPCRMDAFGIITCRDQWPSPAATLMMRALSEAASALYAREVVHEWAQEGV